MIPKESSGSVSLLCLPHFYYCTSNPKGWLQFLTPMFLFYWVYFIVTELTSLSVFFNSSHVSNDYEEYLVQREWII